MNYFITTINRSPITIEVRFIYLNDPGKRSYTDTIFCVYEDSLRATAEIKDTLL